MPDKKLRVLHVLIQPVLVYDDGDELTPGPQAQPVAVPVSGVPDALASLIEQVARIEPDDEP